MNKYEKYIRGLGDMLIADPVDSKTMPADNAFKSIGEIKDGGIALTPGSVSKEQLKKEGPNGPVTVDVVSTKENNTGKGKLIVRDLDLFAKVTGGTVEVTGEGADRKATYTEPEGVEGLKKAVRFITSTKIGDKPVTRDYPMVHITVVDDFTLSSKEWWEASIELEFLAAGKTVYPQPEEVQPEP